MTDTIPQYVGAAGRNVEATPIHAPTIAPAHSWEAITASANVLDPGIVALWVNQACDLTVTGDDDVSLVFTIAGAGPVDIVPKKITAISAGTVFALRAKASE